MYHAHTHARTRSLYPDLPLNKIHELYYTHNRDVGIVQNAQNKLDAEKD